MGGNSCGGDGVGGIDEKKKRKNKLVTVVGGFDEFDVCSLIVIWRRKSVVE